MNVIFCQAKNRRNGIACHSCKAFFKGNDQIAVVEKQTSNFRGEDVVEFYCPPCYKEKYVMSEKQILEIINKDGKYMLSLPRQEAVDFLIKKKLIVWTNSREYTMGFYKFAEGVTYESAIARCQ